MEKYFDGFLYFANWGTRELIIKFPKHTVDLQALRKYVTKESLNVWTTKNDICVRFYREANDDCEEFDDYDEWYSSDGDLYDFMRVRSAVLDHFDYRIFYLGWLMGLQGGEIGGSKLEPPLPQGLQKLSEELVVFQRFFGIKTELVKAAAAKSTKELEYVCDDDYDCSISGMTQTQKFSWLNQLVGHRDKHLGSKFRLEIYRDAGIDYFCDASPRKARDIWRAR